MKYTKTELVKMKKEELIRLVLELQEHTVSNHAQMLAEKRTQKKQERLEGYHNKLIDNKDQVKQMYSNEQVCEFLNISLKTFYNLKIKAFLKEKKIWGSWR